MSDFKKGLFYSPEAGGAEGAATGEGDQPVVKQEGEALQWDAYYASLPAEAQKLFTDRESGLKTALASERDARGKAEKDLRDIAADLDKGSEAQTKVLELADAVATESLKADFYEAAHEKDVSNLKLAYVVAQQDGLIDKRGKIDFDTLKLNYPELFIKKFVPPGGAGDGVGAKLPGEKVDMNALIRKKAGR